MSEEIMEVVAAVVTVVIGTILIDLLLGASSPVPGFIWGTPQSPAAATTSTGVGTSVAGGVAVEAVMS
jgi:hypothetical protein